MLDDDDRHTIKAALLEGSYTWGVYATHNQDAANMCPADVYTETMRQEMGGAFGKIIEASDLPMTMDDNGVSMTLTIMPVEIFDSLIELAMAGMDLDDEVKKVLN